MDTPPADGIELSRDEIDRLLHELSDVLAERGQQVSVYVVGGANIALAFDASRTTTDIDVVAQRGLEALEAASATVAERNPGIRADWINPDFTGGDRRGGITWSWFDHKGLDEPRTYLQSPSLTVKLAGPEMMLALKTIAARDKDMSDIALLMEKTGIRTRQQLGDNIKKFTGERIFQAEGRPGNFVHVVASINEVSARLSPARRALAPAGLLGRLFRRRK